MNAAVHNRHAAESAMRMLYGRTPTEIIADLCACSAVLDRELSTWNTAPNRAAMATAEASVEGIRRLLGQLRLRMEASQ